MIYLESDVCVIGAGVSGVLFAQKLRRLRPSATIALVDAGRAFLDPQPRARARQRFLDYRESAWPRDYVETQFVPGAESQTMAVGGWALHWEGACSRCSLEDLRLNSLYGLGTDWPLEWEELERAYCEAERYLGVAGDPSPYTDDGMTMPYPMPGMPLSATLQAIKSWIEASGLRASVQPVARNTRDYDGRPTCARCDTCTPICPTGARYSPDFAVRRMLADKGFRLYANSLIRRLELDRSSNRVVSASGVTTDGTYQPIEYRAKLFVLALGKYWTPHLLLNSACARFPNGLANSKQLVGKYVAGTASMSARIQLNVPLVYGVHDTNSLVSREFFRCARNAKYVRHDLNFSTRLSRPPLRDRSGAVQIGDELFQRWRAEEKDSVIVSLMFALHPSDVGGIRLDRSRRNKWGDPIPKIEDSVNPVNAKMHRDLVDHFRVICQRLTDAGGGKITGTNIPAPHSVWRSGGCRMSTAAATGVVDSHGRSFDHDNLFIVGAPTLPNPVVGSETLVYAALSLRAVDEAAQTVA